MIVLTSPDLVPRLVLKTNDRISLSNASSATDESCQEPALVEGKFEDGLQRSRIQTACTLTGLFTVLFLAALDFNIVSPALPTIAHDLDSALGFSWIGTSYLLANAASSPIWGRIS